MLCNADDASPIDKVFTLVSVPVRTVLTIVTKFSSKSQPLAVTKIISSGWLATADSNAGLASDEPQAKISDSAARAAARFSGVALTGRNRVGFQFPGIPENNAKLALSAQRRNGTIGRFHRQTERLLRS